jgi:hypothetical protein
MSPDDSDPDHGEEHDGSRSEAAEDGDGGQRRDPETGQFLPKDRQADDASDDDAGEDGAAGDEAAEPDGSDHRVRERGPPLRITTTALGSGADGQPERRPLGRVPGALPPPLHLVPMQVQQTGDPVPSRAGGTPGAPERPPGHRGTAGPRP